jgi:hypothetical protein
MHLEADEGEEAVEGRELRQLALGDLAEVDGVLEASKSTSKTVGVVGKSSDDFEDGVINVSSEALGIALDSTTDGGSNFCGDVSSSFRYTYV